MSNHGSNDMPGANAMGDTLAFVKQLWGSMKIPGMAMPSLSPEDIDKQIADLKAVESWLQVNMNMLRGSIQALEVQSATLTALRSVGESFAKAASGAGSSAPADDKPAFESPFQSSFQSPFQSSFQSPFEQAAQADATVDPASTAAPFANAAVWWNAMQEQFSNVVGQAMQQATPPEAKPPKKTGAKQNVSGKTAAARKRASKTATKTAIKAATKPATKTPTKRASKSAAKRTSRSTTQSRTKGGSQNSSKREGAPESE